MNMKITVDDELYESLMAAYQITEIARLNEVLKRHGVGDTALRERICAEFADANGVSMDRGWLEPTADAARFWPELTFSRRTLDPEEGLGAMEELVLPEYASNFHDYVQGAIEYYFEEHAQTLGEIRAGYV
jgi:hypothetical protein